MKIQNNIFIFILPLILFYPVIPGLYETYMQDSNNSHGLLVPFISLWLAKHVYDLKKDSFQASQFPPIVKGLFLAFLIILICFYYVSFIMGIQFFMRSALVGVIIISAIYALGPHNSRYYLFPLFFLIFLIPVPTTIYSMVALPLQLFTTKVSVFFLNFTPLPVSADGNIIRVGGETLEVAEACSGLRSLLSFIMISSLFAFLSQVKMRAKATIFLLAIPVAITGNLIRIIFTTFIAYLYGSKVASGFIHDLSGYIMFVLTFILFIFISRGFEKWLPSKT